MGCSSSIISSSISPELSALRETKRCNLEAMESCRDWKSHWLEFSDALEQNHLCAAHWIQDECDPESVAENPGNFLGTFKQMSQTTTELFLVSRNFAETLDQHNAFLNDILSKQNDMTEERIVLAKTKSSKLALAKKQPKVAPVNDDHVFTDQEGEMSRIQKKIESLTVEIAEKCKNLYNAKTRTLIVFLYELCSQYEQLLNSFGAIFQTLKCMANEEVFRVAQKELIQQKIAKNNITNKITTQDSRAKDLLKWIKQANHCLISWEKMHASQVSHGWTLYKWLNIMECEATTVRDFKKELKLKAFLLDWLAITDPSYTIHYRGPREEFVAPAHPAINGTKVVQKLNDQILMLTQIRDRELQVKSLINEMMVIQRETGGKVSNNLHFEKALHKVGACMVDNRQFRISKVGNFQSEYWQTFEQYCNEMSSIYLKLSMKCMTLAQEPNSAAAISLSNSSQLHDGLEENSVGSRPESVRLKRKGTQDTVPSISVSPSVDDFRAFQDHELSPHLLNPMIPPKIKEKQPAASPLSMASKRYTTIGMNSNSVGQSIPPLHPSQLGPRRQSLPSGGNDRRQSLPSIDMFGSVRKPPPPVPPVMKTLRSGTLEGEQ